jgi:hypothetical protein
VVDAVANELAWPWTGWSTPFWAVALAFVGLIGLAALGVRWTIIRRRRRSAAG